MKYSRVKTGNLTKVCKLMPANNTDSSYDLPIIFYMPDAGLGACLQHLKPLKHPAMSHLTDERTEGQRC